MILSDFLGKLQEGGSWWNSRKKVKKGVDREEIMW